MLLSEKASYFSLFFDCSYAVLLIETKDKEGQAQVLSAALEVCNALQTDAISYLLSHLPTTYPWASYFVYFIALFVHCVL